jgi:hypothetical protein
MTITTPHIKQLMVLVANTLIILAIGLVLNLIGVQMSFLIGAIVGSVVTFYQDKYIRPLIDEVFTLLW